MTAHDTSTSGTQDRTDDMSFDLSTDWGKDYYTPANPAEPFIDVEVLQLPCSTAFGGYQSPLTGTGFDSGDPLNVFGASGNPCHEDSNASPTVTLIWVPATGQDKNSDPPPHQPVFLLEQAYAEAFADATDSLGNPDTFSGTASDGLGDPAVEMAVGSSVGTIKLSSGRRMVQRDGSSGKITLSRSESATADASSSDPDGWGDATTALGYAVTVLNGYWAGPYYFHNGNNTQDGSDPTPWANNTAGPTPSTTDFPDGTHAFSSSGDFDVAEETIGSITPVWYWTGPDVGVLPPGFAISVSTTASCKSSAYGELDDLTHGLEDGQGDSAVTEPPGSYEFTNSKDETTTVQVVPGAPGEGNGYWAIGQTINLHAIVGDGAANAAMSTSVELDASVSDGAN